MLHLSANDKLKASNVLASLLSLDSWGYDSKYEVDIISTIDFDKSGDYGVRMMLSRNQSFNIVDVKPANIEDLTKEQEAPGSELFLTEIIAPIPYIEFARAGNMCYVVKYELVWVKPRHPAKVVCVQRAWEDFQGIQQKISQLNP